MQYKFIFCLLLSSSLFFLEKVVKLYDYFWKPNVLFSNFCGNCLLSFYFLYCNNCVLNDVNGACWCTWSLVALSVPEMCFWPAKTRQNLELFEMHTCHWPGVQIWLRHKSRKLLSASLLFHYFDGCSCRGFWNEYFSAVFQILDWSFLLQFDGIVCNWIPKVIWTLMDWFWDFWWKMGSFVDFISVWTQICKNCSIVVLFWPHQIFSMFSLRGVLVCSLKMLVLFRHRILHYRLTSIWSEMQLTFYLFVSSSLFILEVLVKLFDYFSKPNGLFSKFSVNYLLMFHFVYCNNCALKDVNGAC